MTAPRVKVTAETITDEQIAWVLAIANTDDDDDLIDACRVAMGERPAGVLYPRSTHRALIDMMAAKRVVTAAWNTRHGGS